MATCKECIHYEICIVVRRNGDDRVLSNSPCKHYIPTADVEEVVHGEWVDNFQAFSSPAGVTKDYLVGYKCSFCGRSEINKEPYCNCGAKMDEKRRDT